MAPAPPNTTDQILDYTVVAANMLQDIAAVSRIPLVGGVCTLALAIVSMVQNTRFQKDSLSVDSDDLQSPDMLDQITQYARTLQKIDSCMREQRELGKIRRLFKQSELIEQLDRCETELKTALSSFRSGTGSLNTSSGSFSMLPASPKIFHGRDSELENVVHGLLNTPARVAILGPGGMGKTTLAVAALHHAEVVEKYSARHFITCDAAHTNRSLIATIASHLGLEASEGNTLLTLFSQITMRGAERPGKVKWTSPFLHPLNALTRMAAYQTFIEITDEIDDESEVDQLLEITDNIPLAVQLVATIAASGGCRTALERWRRERTAMLSAGYDKRSNLELSIDLDLLQMLAPIREYIQSTQPPSIPLVRPLRKHLIDLINKRENARMLTTSSFGHDLTLRIVSNLGNIHNLLLHELDSDRADLIETFHGILALAHFQRLMDRGLTPLMLLLPEALAQLDDHLLKGRFVVEALQATQFYALPDPEKSIHEAIQHFRIAKDVRSEALIYHTGATYLLDHGNTQKAEDFYGKALSLACQCNDNLLQIEAICGQSWTKFFQGDHVEGIRLAREAHRLAVVTGDVRGELISIRSQALSYYGLGDFKSSLQLVTKGKELARRVGMEGSNLESRFMNLEAEIYYLKTEYGVSRDLHQRILAQTSAVISPIVHAYAVINIASSSMLTDLEVVVHDLDAASSTLRAIQDVPGISCCDLLFADLRLRGGDIVGARIEYKRILVETSRDDQACECLVRLANATHCLHVEMELEVARWVVVFLAFTLRRSKTNMLYAHQALRCLGDVLVQQGMEEEALSIFVVALRGFTWMDVHKSRAECMKKIGDIYFKREELSRAYNFWIDARPLFERSLQTKSVAEIDRRIAEMEQQHHANLEHLSRITLPPLPLPLQQDESEQTRLRVDEAPKETSKSILKQFRVHRSA
ncbi:hypothetical protein K438DRAFT_1764556 [Mycena galopus ATCC 62051]|nr:hypothetical protein K438DRAFT_1764556 [Mycena galopus ATCC 62051]